MNKAAKNLDVLAINLKDLHYYFDGHNKIIFKSISS